MTRHVVPLDALLLVVRDGEEQGWDAEFEDLWSRSEQYMDFLATSIQETGIQRPILIGNDGRVWDGHHRLAAAHKLGMGEVPVTFSGEDEETPRVLRWLGPKCGSSSTGDDDGIQ